MAYLAILPRNLSLLRLCEFLPHFCCVVFASCRADHLSPPRDGEEKEDGAFYLDG